MKVYLNAITGVDDALITMFMSKRTWSRELEIDVRKLCERVLYRDGSFNGKATEEDLNRFNKYVSNLCKFGVKHITMLRYIDLSVTVEGLHRGAQDDFDSHAKRLENRIVRSSTRLATFNNEEKSEWYQDKILYPFEALEIAKVDIPDYVVKDGIKFVKTDFGYVNESLANNKDAKRGLYPLAIPSNFTFKVNLTELSHIVKERDINSSANPELQTMIELLKDEIRVVNPMLANILYTIKN